MAPFQPAATHDRSCDVPTNYSLRNAVVLLEVPCLLDSAYLCAGKVRDFNRGTQSTNDGWLSMLERTSFLIEVLVGKITMAIKAIALARRLADKLCQHCDIHAASHGSIATGLSAVASMVQKSHARSKVRSYRKQQQRYSSFSFIHYRVMIR